MSQEDVLKMQTQYESLCKQRDVINNSIADTLKLLKQYQPQPPNMRNVLFSIVRDFNVVIDLEQDIPESDYHVLFGKEPVRCYNDEEKPPTIYDILVDAGCFESKGQARKNWQGIKEIPTGYSEIGPIGKQKLFLFIWNPTE